MLFVGMPVLITMLRIYHLCLSFFVVDKNFQLCSLSRVQRVKELGSSPGCLLMRISWGEASLWHFDMSASLVLFSYRKGTLQKSS